jgi:hypothetical protein
MRDQNQTSAVDEGCEDFFLILMLLCKNNNIRKVMQSIRKEYEYILKDKAHCYECMGTRITKIRETRKISNHLISNDSIVNKMIKNSP